VQQPAWSARLASTLHRRLQSAPSARLERSRRKALRSVRTATKGSISPKKATSHAKIVLLANTLLRQARRIALRVLCRNSVPQDLRSATIARLVNSATKLELQVASLALQGGSAAMASPPARTALKGGHQAQGLQAVSPALWARAQLRLRALLSVPSVLPVRLLRQPRHYATRVSLGSMLCRGQQAVPIVLLGTMLHSLAMLPVRLALLARSSRARGRPLVWHVWQATTLSLGRVAARSVRLGSGRMVQQWDAKAALQASMDLPREAPSPSVCRVPLAKCQAAGPQNAPVVGWGHMRRGELPVKAAQQVASKTAQEQLIARPRKMTVSSVLLGRSQQRDLQAVWSAEQAPALLLGQAPVQNAILVSTARLGNSVATAVLDAIQASRAALTAQSALWESTMHGLVSSTTARPAARAQ